MHDLQTIIKLNAPLNQRTSPAVAAAYAIAITRQSAKSEAIPEVDRVEYGAK